MTSKSFINQLGQLINVFWGKNDVGELMGNPLEECEYMYFTQNNVFDVIQSNLISSKAKPSKTEDAAIKAIQKGLTKKKPEKKQCNNSQFSSEIHTSNLTADKKVRNIRNNTEQAATIDEADTSCNTPCKTAKVENKTNKTIDINGDIKEEHRSAESLRRAHKRLEPLVLSSCNFERSLFMTFTTDTKPSYAEINRIVTKFNKYVFVAYKGVIKCIFNFIEPHADGSWHSHHIASFYGDIPADFEANVKKWWRKHNEKECENQVKMRGFKDFDDLFKTVQYLKPTNDKKRGRIGYYPKSAQPMRSSGDVDKPIRLRLTLALAFALIKKIAGTELPALRKKIEVFDDDVRLYHRSEHYFVCNSIISQNDDNVKQNTPIMHGISTSNQIMNKANQKQPCQGNPNQAST
jgi:hypothetical protein